MILYGSDLHLGNWTKIDYVNYIIGPLKKKYSEKELSNSVLILAGDFSESIYSIQECIDIINSNLNLKQILLTFGNHDLYMLGKDKIQFENSINKYNFLISHFNQIENVTVLDLESYETKEKIIVGNMGWYDPIKNISIEKMKILEYYGCEKKNFDKGSFLNFGINDKNYIIGENGKIFSDSKFSNNFLKDLEKKLKLNSKKGKEIIAVSHYCPSSKIEINSPFKFDEKLESIITDENKSNYKNDIRNLFSNFFFVNEKISKLYEKYKVSKAIYGHTHYQVEDFNVNGVKYYSNPFGYLNYDYKEDFYLKELK